MIKLFSGPVEPLIENCPESGSGRTDAGVHALGQVAHFKCDTRLNAAQFENGLYSLLPDGRTAPNGWAFTDGGVDVLVGATGSAGGSWS